MIRSASLLYRALAVTLTALLLAAPALADHHRGGNNQDGERGERHGQRGEMGERGRHGGMGRGREHRLFVTITGSATQDRAMPLTLANKAVDQGLEVRVLLCGDGAELALADYQAEAFDPPGVTPKDLLGRLLSNGVTVEVCAIFLPNTDYDEDDLTDGIGIAAPDDVAEYMMGPRTRIFSN
ncbi:MAG: DsrE family protein [Wenzhouxiangella sp.]